MRGRVPVSSALAALVVQLLVSGCADAPAAKPATPPPVLSKDDASSCPVADARGGTTDVPWNDPARMKALEGLDGKTPAKVSIQWPAEDQILDEGKGLVRYTVDGFAIGKDEKAGFQHCRVVLDNTGFAADYDHTVTLESLNGGKPLAEGSHLLTIFPVRSSGISLKNEGACRQVVFHVKTKKGKLPDATTEQVILNVPDGSYDSARGEARNVLCDFFLRGVPMANERLIKDLNVVVVVVDPDGKFARLRSSDWAPLVLLRDPKPGRYKVTISLEERDDGDPLDVPFAETTREITVK